jgi:O-acetyl-ADP-ribose deacetylase (regulator of RNase III)
MQRLPKLRGFRSYRVKAENIYTEQLNGLTGKVNNKVLASAGEEGVLKIAWWDGDTSKYRCKAGIVGESLDKDGSVIQPSTYYRLAADRKLERLPLADRIEIMLGDITKLDERPDVIVNAANESLLGGGGVDGAIHAAAGPDLLKACQGLGGCKTGHVKITEGYGLRCKYIFHAVGPRWAGGEHGEVVDLAAVYRRIVEKAAELKALTVVVPSISTGAFGYPLEQAAEVAVESLAKALDKAPLVRSVKFVCFDDKTKAAYLVAHRHYFAAPAQSLNKVQ